MCNQAPKTYWDNFVEKLREELGGLGAIGRPKLILRGSDNAIYGKYVAQPKVIQHPRGDTPTYMVFQGFSTPPPGLQRSLFIGELTEDFELRNIRLLMRYDYFGSQFDSLEAPCIVYDEANDGWIMLVCVHDSTIPIWSQSWKMAFLRWDKYFSRVTYQYFPMTITPYGGSPEEWMASDGGCSLISLPKGADVQKAIGISRIDYTTTTDPAYTLYWIRCLNLESNPPTFERSRTPAIYRPSPSDTPLLPYLFDLGDSFVCLIDTGRGNNMWHLTVGYITPTMRTYDTTLDRIMGLSFVPLPALGHSGQHGMIHPFITNLPDNAWNLFYALGGPKSYCHEIWCARIDPSLFRLRNRDFVLWIPWLNTSISVGSTSIPFSGVGKKTIYFSSSASGDLTVQASPDGVTWFDLLYIPSVTSTVKEITSEAYAMRLKFSASATVSAYVVQSPRG